MISFGWRWMFVSMGLLGIAVAIMWYTVYREVAEAALCPGEAHHLTEGEEEPPPAQHVTLAKSRAGGPLTQSTLSATVKRDAFTEETALPARQYPGELAYRLLMLLVPDFGKVLANPTCIPGAASSAARPFLSDTFVKIGDRRAQRAGDLK